MTACADMYSSKFANAAVIVKEVSQQVCVYVLGWIPAFAGMTVCLNRVV